MPFSFYVNTGSLISGVAFLAYGFGCLFTEGLRREFERFGLSRFRRFIGITQVFGGAALLAGPWIPFLGLLASLGLTLQMFAGVLVRIRIRDSFQQSLQALVFFFLNLFLFLAYLRSL